MECPICCYQMTRMIRLPCLHLVHLECLREWIRLRQRSCPYCRRRFNPMHYRGPRSEVRGPRSEVRTSDYGT
ncbi:MAG: RING finger domain-containing protein [Sulfobacillus sp.]